MGMEPADKSSKKFQCEGEECVGEGEGLELA